MVPVLESFEYNRWQVGRLQSCLYFCLIFPSFPQLFCQTVKVLPSIKSEQTFSSVGLSIKPQMRFIKNLGVIQYSYLKGSLDTSEFCFQIEQQLAHSFNQLWLPVQMLQLNLPWPRYNRCLGTKQRQVTKEGPQDPRSFELTIPQSPTSSNRLNGLSTHHSLSYLHEPCGLSSNLKIRKIPSI